MDQLIPAQGLVVVAGNVFLFAAGGASLAVAALSLAGASPTREALVGTARRGLLAVFALVAGATACLLVALWRGDYNLRYVFDYSETYLSPAFRCAALWAGMEGSLLLWTFVLATVSAAVALHFRSRALSGDERCLEPWVHLVLSTMIFLFIFITWNEEPFRTLEPVERLAMSRRHGIPLDADGNLLDGLGLNPQLLTWWFLIHPPALYLGFIVWTVPLAFAVAGLVTGEMGPSWLRIVRGWSLVAWSLLTAGIVLGGFWAYRQLGWGGYWKWDPVENASLFPWLTGTAFLHALLVSNRRQMLRSWSLFLLFATFFLTIFGTWMTRSGVVSSIHAFAGGDAALRLQYSLFAIAAASAFLLAWRFRMLRGSRPLESLASREGALFASQAILALLAVGVGVLSFLPRLSRDWLGRTFTVDDERALGAAYNLVANPFFAALLFLTAVGPSLKWGRGPGRGLLRALLAPAVATVASIVVLYGALYLQGDGLRSLGVLGPQATDSRPVALYPTGLLLGLSVFTVAAVLWSFLRDTRRFMVKNNLGLLRALAGHFTWNHRPTGARIVHFGVAVLAVGLVASSMFQVKVETIRAIGEPVRVGPYLVTAVDSSTRDAPVPGEPYGRDQVRFQVTRAPIEEAAASGPASAPASAPGAGEGGSRPAPPAAKASDLVAELVAERRHYPKKDQWISEVSISRRLAEDIYLYYAARDAEGNVSFAVCLNPLVLALYLGWIIMTLGSIVALVPMGRQVPAGRPECATGSLPQCGEEED